MNGIFVAVCKGMGEKAEAPDESFFLESAVIRPVFGMKEWSTRTQKDWTDTFGKHSSEVLISILLGRLFKGTWQRGGFSGVFADIGSA
jgi:hypothetical protein